MQATTKKPAESDICQCIGEAIFSLVLLSCQQWKRFKNGCTNRTFQRTDATTHRCTPKRRSSAGQQSGIASFTNYWNEGRRNVERIKKRGSNSSSKLYRERSAARPKHDLLSSQLLAVPINQDIQGALPDPLLGHKNIQSCTCHLI
ncbi:hypothetical protein [Pseudomonas sp. DG56-2]|uniref:hypothetical protein n=1 Tax=Pseudomonas sp. DG56-2 TaxID=2320270 RepID=UPI001C49A337|nr:hypothetical protein [Pseudomonas sp. DG56-2]